MPTAKEREEKKALKLQAELERIENMCSYEKEYAGYTYICGIDGLAEVHLQVLL